MKMKKKKVKTLDTKGVKEVLSYRGRIWLGIHLYNEYWVYPIRNAHYWNEWGIKNIRFASTFPSKEDAKRWIRKQGEEGMLYYETVSIMETFAEFKRQLECVDTLNPHTKN